MSIHPNRRSAMSSKPEDALPVVRIELTEEQRKRIRDEMGREATAVVFNADELEDRVAPRATFELF
jgi:hypothetical protein